MARHAEEAEVNGLIAPKCYNRLSFRSYKEETMVATVIICIVIVVAGFFAGRQAIRTFSGDGSCCGKKSAKKAGRVRVTDTDEANYPYTTDVPVGGMTCEKCVAAVENALNSIDGVWARVSLAEKNAHVLSKQPLDMERAKDVLRDAGYYVIQR